MDADAIAATRACFEPRRLVAQARWAVRPPSWMPGDDGLMVTYRQQARLFGAGRVVWGKTVQANNNLFQPGPDAHPALFVHGLDHTLDDEVDALHELAHEIYALKGTAPDDADEQQVAAGVTDEMSRKGYVPVPRKLAGGLELFTSTIMIHRESLPERFLSHQRALPLLLDPDTGAGLVLPCEYWSAPVLAAWGVGAT